MTLWIDSNWLGSVKIPANCPRLEESIKEKGRSGCRYVRIGNQNNDVYITNVFDRDKAVPDVERYNIHKSGCTVRLVLHRRSKNNVRSQDNDYNDRLCKQNYLGDTVVFLLESPHKNEYDNNNDPIAPAQGDTGRKIHRYRGEIFHSCQNLTDQIAGGRNTRVILCNPVQFQTSLHMILDGSLQDERRVWRDRIWSALWNESIIQRCFWARMEIYSPKFVINACTGERTCPNQRNIDSLKRKITAFLKRTGVENIYEVGHPSGWRSPDNIKIENV